MKVPSPLFVADTIPLPSAPSLPDIPCGPSAPAGPCGPCGPGTVESAPAGPVWPTTSLNKTISLVRPLSKNCPSHGLQ